MDIRELIDKWLEITNYKKDQKSFKVNFSHSYDLSEYEIHKRNELILKVMEEYGSEELVACLFKSLVEQYVKETTVTVYDVLENDFSIFFKFYNDYKAFNIDSKIQNVINILDQFYKNKNLIGSTGVEDVVTAVVGVLENIKDLNFVPLHTSGLPITNLNLSYNNEIKVYKSLLECSIEATNFPDGIYIAYITNDGEYSSDGFFTYILKSNGNLISINDQLKEEYIGQHTSLRTRNANYINDKSWNIFPYSLFETSGSDSKGNKTEFSLKEEKPTIENLPLDDSLRIYICMLLITYKYKNQTIAKDLINYSTAIVNPDNLIESKALVVSNTGLALKQNYEQILNMKVDRTELVNSFEAKKNWCSENTSRVLFETWFDESMIDEETLGCTALINPGEFIGTEKELKEQLLFKSKLKVVEKIQNKMINYLQAHDYGTGDIYTFRKTLLSKKESVMNNIFKAIINKQFGQLGFNVRFDAPYYDEFWTKRDISITSFNFAINEEDLRIDNGLKDDCGTVNVVIHINCNNYKDLMELTGLTINNLPKTAIGWSRDRNDGGVNTLLDLYDPYQTIQNAYQYSKYAADEEDPFHHSYWDKWHFEARDICRCSNYTPFEFDILLSKRKYNKLVKEAEENGNN